MRKLLLLALLLPACQLLAQKEAFKVMTYNLMYYQSQGPPCSHSVSLQNRNNAFKTIFQHVQPDILLVNELGAYPDNSGATYVLSNLINVDGESDFHSGAYSNDGSSSIVNQIFFDSTRFALHSQSAITHELAGQKLVRVIDLYRLYYKDPGLKLGADTVFITLVSAHLKAGQSQADEDNREDAAQALMSYLANNVNDENVIVTGDFNMYSAAEGAWQEMVNNSVASERLIDPVNQAGSWNNNGSFALVHTQSTHSSSSGCFSGGGMDDRFDLILHSQGIKNATDKVNYVLGSYAIIGQDGQHFNQSVNSGTNFSVPSAVANALYDFSDHLPVTAEYEVFVSGIGLAEPYELSELIEFKNPVDEFLLLKNRRPDSHDIDIEVISLNGKTIYQGSFPAREPSLLVSTAGWPDGIYLLRIKNQHGLTFTHKLVKQKYAR